MAACGAASVYRHGTGVGGRHGPSGFLTWVGVRSPRDQNSGETLQHRLSPLIAQEDSVAKNSPIGFGFRLAFLQNSYVEVEFVVRANWIRQPQFIPAQSCK